MSERTLEQALAYFRKTDQLDYSDISYEIYVPKVGLLARHSGPGIRIRTVHIVTKSNGSPPRAFMYEETDSMYSSATIEHFVEGLEIYELDRVF